MGKRHDAGMLWAEYEIEMRHNYFSAVVQLKSLEKRLTKDQPLREKYLNTIKEDLYKGYVVRVKDVLKEESCSEREWYLPHHPVVNPNKPGKVRRLINGEAKLHGASPKSFITGPDWLKILIYTSTARTISIFRLLQVGV